MSRMNAPQGPGVWALAVGVPDGERQGLEEIFRDCGWRIGWARTRSEARKFLDDTPVPVVISEGELPEGGWREMLEELEERADPPALIVMSRLADDALWAEVLNRGGYDVLPKPLDEEEVTRVIDAAARHFDHEQQRRKPVRLAVAS